MVGQEKPALDKCLCGVGGVEALAECVSPNLRQDPPLTIITGAVDVAEAVRHWAGVRV